MNEEYVNKLINKLSEAEHAYYVLNSPIMSDGEYDKLFKELKQIENENSQNLCRPRFCSKNSCGAHVTNDFVL